MAGDAAFTVRASNAFAPVAALLAAVRPFETVRAVAVAWVFLIAVNVKSTAPLR
jgi:hypothetical protein